MSKVSTHIPFRSLTIAAVVALFAVASPVQSIGAEKSAAAQSSDTEKKPVRVPFRGKINAVDKLGMTVTLDGKEKKRVIHITPQTRIAKAGKPAKLEDAVIGEEVGGQAIRSTNGKEEAVSLRIGPKPDAKGKGKDDAEEES
jgi:hypothetical protein